MFTYSRNIPELEPCDVLVAGGGLAGCTAAISAAREGKKVLLIEKGSCLGGMSAGGRIPHWHGHSNGNGFYPFRGIAEEIIAKMNTHIPENLQTAGPVGWAIDAEVMKRIYDEMTAEAGVEVLLETTLCDVLTDGQGRVTRFLLANKAGLSAASARAYLDCTGDADAVAMAGGEFEQGDEEGEVQAVTLCFLITGIKGNPFDFKTRIRLSDPRQHCTYSWIGPGAYCMNAGHIYMKNPNDPRERSAALAEGRRIASEIFEDIRKIYPDLTVEARLAATAEELGVRESRRILGDYKLTDMDYLARRDFPDEIARNCSNLDSHATRREARILAAGGTLPYKNEDFIYAPGESHGIPYRCLLPRGLSNLAVAGRTLCSERRSNGSCRMMSVCMSMGEAMGLAAAMASEQEIPDFRRVDTDELRRKLKEERNAYLH